MSPITLRPADGSDWTIDTAPIADGVELAIAFLLDGQPITAKFALDRASALALADGVRRDAGDAMMRTYPRPSIERG